MASQQKVTIEIPKGLGPSQREAIASEIIEYIRERTISGRDKNNKKFAKYSETYAKRKGVSRDAVDLVLTGELISEMQLLTHRSGAVTIGYEKGNESLNGKVEGNRKGTYGNKSAVVPGRDFLGITDEDLKNKILDKFQPSQEQVEEAADREARRILGAPSGEDS